ncbi:MAG: class I SAM-dependent methyltransferase [Flavobacteriales bacterium]
MGSAPGTFNPKEHWEAVYQRKQLTEVSWYQAVPQVSLDLLKANDVPKDAAIIDVGGGDSLLVDHLLESGYTNVSVLDISGGALLRAQERLGDRARAVHWFEADATHHRSDALYDVWHDRAVFHFLTEEADAERYLQRISEQLRPGGLLILGTFSTNGPEKCSGIAVKRYSEAEMLERLRQLCDKVKCFTIDHTTPSGAVQNFLFCAFRKK